MLKGPIVTVIVTVLAFCVVLYAFTNNASPYVTIAEARISPGDHLHVAGDVVKDTVHLDPLRHTLSFEMKDAGGTIHVLYDGEPPNNLGEVKKVVAIGGMQNGEFVSHELLIKCPSKYEGADGSSKSPSAAS